MASQLCQRPVAGAMAPGGLRRPAPQPRAWAPRLARPGQASAPALQLGSGMISSISNGSNAARRGMRVPTSTGSDSAAASSSPAPSGVVGALSTVDITEKLGNTNPLVQVCFVWRCVLGRAGGERVGWSVGVWCGCGCGVGVGVGVGVGMERRKGLGWGWVGDGCEAGRECVCVCMGVSRGWWGRKGGGETRSPGLDEYPFSKQLPLTAADSHKLPDIFTQTYIRTHIHTCAGVRNMS